MSDPLLVQHEANSVTLLFNRPRCRNALSHALLTALGDALTRQVGPGTSKVLITGAGDCFSAGADLGELDGTINDLWIDDDIAMVTEKIRSLAAPVIALVNGPCVGGAVDIALSCDQRIASAHAYFQVPATSLGLLYNPVSVKRMVERYGKKLVHRLLVNGERFDAHSALEAGIVSSVRGETAGQLRQRWQADGKPGKAATATGAMIEAIDRGDFDPDYWQQVRLEFLGSDERFEAIAATKARSKSRES